MPSIASTILIGCLGLAHGERFTVVVDEESLPRALELQREPTRRALGRGARVASMGGSTEAMLARLLDGGLRRPGSLGNVPFGEGYIAPVGGEGRILATTIAGQGRLAELGIGAHHAARISGNVLEDEKALGSAHVAFGSSTGFGGEVTVAVHIDCIVADALIELDGRPLHPAVAGR